MPNRHHFRKKIIPTYIAVFFLSTLCPFAKAQSTGAYNDKMAQNVIWESKLRSQVEFYCDSILSGRAMGTRGGVETSFALIRHFQKTGLLPLSGSYVQSFSTEDGKRTGHNVVGMIPGSNKAPTNSYIVVGAHYDHIGMLDGKHYPGADNNASGLVAMTSLAEMFQSMRILGKSYNSSIIFVAFDGKELSMAGSYAFWKALKLGRFTDPATGRKIMAEDIKFMVNIDEIGASLSPLRSGRKDYIIMLGEQSLPNYAKGQLSICNRFYDINLELALNYYGSENFTKLFYTLSDQRPFVENGVPAVMFTSGITMNTNKTYDTPATLNYPVLQRRISLIYFWLSRLLSR